MPTINTKDYNLDTTLNPNAVRYNGPGHSFMVVDVMDFKRTAPKATKDFAGMARAQIKFNRTLFTDATGKKTSGSLTIDAAIPVGAIEADINSLLSDAAAVLAGAIGRGVIIKHDITQ